LCFRFLIREIDEQLKMPFQTINARTQRAACLLLLVSKKFFVRVLCLGLIAQTESSQLFQGAENAVEF